MVIIIIMIILIIVIIKILRTESVCTSKNQMLIFRLEPDQKSRTRKCERDDKLMGLAVNKTSLVYLMPCSDSN
jgi:hypothetical protein